MNITHTPSDTSIGRFHKHTFVYVCAHAEKVNCSNELIAQMQKAGCELLRAVYTRNNGIDRADFEFLVNPFISFMDLSRLQILAQTLKLYIYVFDIEGGAFLGERNHITYDYLETYPENNAYAFQAKYDECFVPADKHTPLAFRRYPQHFDTYDTGTALVSFQRFQGIISDSLTIADISIREGLAYWVGLHHTGVWVYANTGKELAKLLLEKTFTNPYMMDVSKELFFNAISHRATDTILLDEEVNGRNTVYFIYRKLFKYVDVQMFRQIMTAIPYERFKPLLDAWRVPPTVVQPSDDELLALIKQI